MRAPFHVLPRIPGLQILHERPYICVLPNILTSDECKRLRAKASQTLLPQQSFDSAGTAGTRTSHGCVMRNDEVPTLRARFATTLGVSVTQLQPLKVTRYTAGQKFDMHTDAIMGDRRELPEDPTDWFADGPRSRHGVPGAPFRGCNRICTLFVYLNTVAQGGQTRWRWTRHDQALGGTHGETFYDSPGPGAGKTDGSGGSGLEIAVAPEEGLGVLHFPAVTPDAGGFTDYNAYHEAEPAIDEKWVAQQVRGWPHRRGRGGRSHGLLYWPCSLDLPETDTSSRMCCVRVCVRAPRSSSGLTRSLTGGVY
jgi:hypothetical protein